MNFALLLPGALFALAALLLPVLLHLARRNQQPPLAFAALRWLQRKPRPRRQWRLQDLPLLLLRLLLLALLALWLAQPVLQHAPDQRAWVAVMPGVAQATVQQQSLPSDARLHWLALGFPSLAHAAPTCPQPVSSLLRELDAQLPPHTPLIVLATATYDGADAQQPQLSRAVQWRIVAGTPPPTAPSLPAAAPRLQLMADASHRAQAGYLQAAAQAWQTPARPLSTINLPPTDSNNVLAWWSDAPLPARVQDWVRRGGTVLLPANQHLPGRIRGLPLWQRDNGEVLLEAASLGRGRLLRFPLPLQPATLPELLDADFPQQLQAALQAKMALPTRADARSHAPRTGAATPAQVPYSLQPWLALLLALLFLIERIWASGQRRGAGP